MKLKSLKLRGFIGVKDGLGVDDVALDLANLSGIVALVGPNGKGKTTVLENLTPYRTLPSRKMALRNAVYLRDAARDLEFEYGGKSYRELLTIDSHNGQGDGFLYEDGRPLTTGKVSEVDEQIEKLFGSEDLFFHSVFAAQAAESILSLRPAQRRDCFAEFLGLEKLQEYSDSAKKISDFLIGYQSGSEAEKTRLAGEIVAAGEPEKELARVRAALGLIIEEIAKQNAILAEKKQALADIEAQAQGHHTAQGQVNYWMSQREARAAALTAEGKAKRQAVDYWEAEIRKKIEAINLIKSKLALLDRHGAKEIILGNLVNLERTEADGIKQQQIAIQAATIQGRIDKLENDYRRKENQIEQNLAGLKKIKEAVESRPKDAKEAVCRRCGLVKMSYAAMDNEPAWRKELAETTRKKNEALAILQKDMPTGVTLESHNMIAERLEKIRKEIKNLQVKLNDLSQRDAIEESQSAAEQDVFSYRAKKVEAEEALSVHRDLWVTQLKEIDDKIAEHKKSLIPGMEERIAQAQIQVREVEAVLTLRAGEKSIADGKIQFLGHMINDLKSKRARLAELIESLKFNEAEQAEWRMLSLLCGREKLQALELDAAAPAISEKANTLLSLCFGGRFTIKFKTLDEDGKEVFDIVVDDSQAVLGSEKALRDMSGGEKVIVLHALRLALTLYAKEKSGRDFKTLFCDEVDSALYKDARREFADMNRGAMKLGEFDTFFIVTHSDELSETADFVINFGEGEITILRAGEKVAA